MFVKKMNIKNITVKNKNSKICTIINCFSKKKEIINNKILCIKRNKNILIVDCTEF